MLFNSLAAVAALSTVVVAGSFEKRTAHTGCYNYYKDTLGFVPSGKSYVKVENAQKFHFGNKTPIPIAGPKDTHSNPGICKYYNSSTELGVCLWSGSDPSGNIIPQSGWLNGAKRSNCGKMVEVKANGKTIHAKLVDGCGLEATTPAKGCSIAWLTIAAFNALASPTETEGNGIASIEWKFLDGPV